MSGRFRSVLIAGGISVFKSTKRLRIGHLKMAQEGVGLHAGSFSRIGSNTSSHTSPGTVRPRSTWRWDGVSIRRRPRGVRSVSRWPLFVR